MKKIFCLLLVMLVCTSSMAQEKLSFTKVIQAEGISKSALYVALRSFAADYYHDSKEVIQMDDKDACLLIGKATSVFDKPSLALSSYEGYIDYTFKLQSKDGRVRVEVTNFFHHVKPGNAEISNLGSLTTAEQYTDKGMSKKFHNKVWGMLKDQAEQISAGIFAAVEKSIKENAASANTEEDW